MAIKFKEINLASVIMLITDNPNNPTGFSFHPSSPAYTVTSKKHQEIVIKLSKTELKGIIQHAKKLLRD
jgi:hypothetical protein